MILMGHAACNAFKKLHALADVLSFLIAANTQRVARSITGRPYFSWSQTQQYSMCPRAFAFKSRSVADWLAGHGSRQRLWISITGNSSAPAGGRSGQPRYSAAFWRMTVFRFYARPHARATVSLPYAQVIAAVEVLSRALRALHRRVSA